MNAPPQIPGYDFGQRLLTHPLAEIWRGRSRTGMEVMAIVLSDAGATDPQVRERLDHASRAAALQPGHGETPLWAANLTAPRPYAITQLIPGQTGAERLLDPLDGVIGNDQTSVEEVRRELQQYGAAPLTWHTGQSTSYDASAPSGQAWKPSGQAWNHSAGAPPAQASYQGAFGQDGMAAEGLAARGGVVAPSAEQRFLAEFKRRMGWRYYPAFVAAFLVLFTIAYSVGAALNPPDEQPATDRSAVPPAVSPTPWPSPVVKPGIDKLESVALRNVPQRVILGDTYDAKHRAEPVTDIGLPFAFRWPSEPGKVILGESSYSIYRRVISGEDPRNADVDAQIAVHPCKDLTTCLGERKAFDERWMKRYRRAPAPAAQKDAQTWFTERKAAPGGTPYTLSMTRVFRSGDQWWLVGVVIYAKDGHEAAAQRVLNDIRTQTP